MNVNLFGWLRDKANGYLYPRTLTDKVGIGTNAPSASLSIAVAQAGTEQIKGQFEGTNTSSDLSKIQIGGGETTHLRAYVEARQTWDGTYTDSELGFITTEGGVGDGEWLTILGNGNVIIPKAKVTTLAGNGVQTVDMMEAGLDTEKITNGVFADGSGWTLAGSATISAGVAHFLADSGTSSIYQAVGALDNADYTLSFDIAGADAWVTVHDTLNSVFPVQASYAIGHHDIVFTAAVGAVVDFGAASINGGGPTATIDNISLKKHIFVNATVTPTNLSIRLTNAQANATPQITLAPGDLPNESIITIRNAATDYGCNIYADGAGPECYIDIYQAIQYIKDGTHGWIPFVGVIASS
jgi:hypothetical protein